MNSARNKKRARNYRSVDISISISISIWEAKIWKESTWREKGRRHFEFDPTEGRSDSLRTLYYYFISFPFLSAIINQNKDAKLVPYSHPFSIECPHQSITLAFFPSIPCFFSWLLNNKLSSRITTLSTNHQKNGRNNKFGFFHLGLLLFLWFLFCFVLFVVQVVLNTEMGFVVLFGIFKCIQRWKSGNKTIKRISRDLLCFHWMMILLFQVLLAPLFPISSF